MILVTSCYCIKHARHIEMKRRSADAIVPTSINFAPATGRLQGIVKRILALVTIWQRQRRALAAAEIKDEYVNLGTIDGRQDPGMEQHRIAQVSPANTLPLQSERGNKRDAKQQARASHKLVR